MSKRVELEKSKDDGYFITSLYIPKANKKDVELFKQLIMHDNKIINNPQGKATRKG